MAARLAEECEVTISYAIGVSEPTSIDINTFYTGQYNDLFLKQLVEKVFDLKVGHMIDKLDLKRAVFSQTSVGGHFGKEYFLWENTDKIGALQDSIKYLLGYEKTLLD